MRHFFLFIFMLGCTEPVDDFYRNNLVVSNSMGIGNVYSILDAIPFEVPYPDYLDKCIPPERTIIDNFNIPDLSGIYLITYGEVIYTDNDGKETTIILTEKTGAFVPIGQAGSIGICKSCVGELMEKGNTYYFTCNSVNFIDERMSFLTNYIESVGEFIFDGDFVTVDLKEEVYNDDLNYSTSAHSKLEAVYNETITIEIRGE